MFQHKRKRYDVSHYMQVKDNAIFKKIQWSLSEEFEKYIIDQPCYFCNSKDTKNTIGRLDCIVGYIESNCIPCCESCLHVKGNLDAITFIKRCIHINTCHTDNTIGEYVSAWRDCNAGTYNEYIRNARYKNIPFDLNITSFHNIAGERCYYCWRSDSDDHENGIDRIDNNKGYIISNCVACCSECNYMKGPMDIQDFMNVCKQVSDNEINCNIMKILLSGERITRCVYHRLK